MSQSTSEGWQVLSEGSGSALQPLAPGPTRDGDLAVREEPHSVLRSSSKTDVLHVYRKDKQGAGSLLGHTLFQAHVGGGSWGGSSVLTVTVISGHFLEVPSAGETIWPETHHQKQTCLVCRLSLFSLTCDWLHHVQQENVDGRTANKFIATANCSVITLFHEWLLNIHYWQSPHRWSDLSTCRGLWLVADCY